VIIDGKMDKADVVSFHMNPQVLMTEKRRSSCENNGDKFG
jgi:hypothetical protein